MRHGPSFPNNIKHWKIFEYDQQIKEFFSMVEDFQGTDIDQDEYEATEVVEVIGLKNSIVDQKIIQLKDNTLPRGLVPLERLFNSNDVAVGSEKIPRDEQIQDHNIGTQLEPKLAKLFNGFPSNYKERYIKICKDYVDVFACSYEDLKTYDLSIIQHKIPLKEGIKPFKQKLR